MAGLEPRMGASEREMNKASLTGCGGSDRLRALNGSLRERVKACSSVLD